MVSPPPPPAIHGIPLLNVATPALQLAATETFICKNKFHESHDIPN